MADRRSCGATGSGSEANRRLRTEWRKRVPDAPVRLDTPFSASLRPPLDDRQKKQRLTFAWKPLFLLKYARRDSNARPADSKSDALSS